MSNEGQIMSDGSWVGVKDSPYRNLTAEEVKAAREAAEAAPPRFTGHYDPDDPRRWLDPDADAPWERHHPVTREVWEKRGMKPPETTG